MIWLWRAVGSECKQTRNPELWSAHMVPLLWNSTYHELQYWPAVVVETEADIEFSRLDGKDKKW